MSRLLRTVALSGVIALGLTVFGASTASAHDPWINSPARIHVHRYGYLAGYGPSIYHPRSLYGRSLYVSPPVSVYSSPAIGLYGPAPGFYRRPFAYGYNYYHGPYDYSYHYGW
jgi:hypothetical protein